MATLLHEVYALKYAHHPRRASENFLDGRPRDAHDGPMPLDYFIWLIRGASGDIVVDTGFSAAVAARRGRLHLRCPASALAGLGVDARKVRDVVITHLHYDHVGNFDLFPAATFHLQDLEMQFATSRHMTEQRHAMAFDAEDVVGMVRNVYAGRVRFHAGDAEIFPGVSVHLIGGHTPGLQVVRVRTRRGWVVLASDATHYYANLEQERPYPIVWSLEDMRAGYVRVRELADSPGHVIPGHDPLVLERYAACDGLAGVAARLD